MIELTMIILHVLHNNYLNGIRVELKIVENNGLSDIQKSFEDLAVC